MTDARTPAASKPMWTRHKPGCGQRIFNDPIDIDNHRRYCPAKFETDLKRLSDKLAAIEAQVGSVSEQVEAGPAIDPEDIAPWDEDGDEAAETGDELENGIVATETGTSSSYFADDEDEPDYGTVSPRTI